MGMVDRVHGGAADMGALAFPHVTAGLADHFVHMVGIGHRAHRGHAGQRDLAHFRRIQADQRITGVAAQILGIGAGALSGLNSYRPQSIKTSLFRLLLPLMFSARVDYARKAQKQRVAGDN